jgi:GGDEF domain-containing protein
MSEVKSDPMQQNIIRGHPSRQRLIDQKRQELSQQIQDRFKQSEQPPPNEQFLRSQIEQELDLHRQIWEEKIHNIQTENIINYDKDTGLKNKKSFSEDLGKLLRETNKRQGEGLFVVHIDLGLLNLVNAERQQSGGDEYIKAFAELWKNEKPADIKKIAPFSFYESYRTGGDEFALIIKGSEKDVLDYIKKQKDLIVNNPDKLLQLECKKRKLTQELVMDAGIVEVSQKIVNIYDKVNQTFINQSSDQYYEDLSEFIYKISDWRLKIVKGIKRLKYYFELYQKGDIQLLRDIYPYASKGAFGITEDEISAINPKFYESFIQNFVADNIKSRIENVVKRAETDDPKKLKLNQALLDKFDQLFF